MVDVIVVFRPHVIVELNTLLTKNRYTILHVDVGYTLCSQHTTYGEFVGSSIQDRNIDGAS